MRECYEINTISFFIFAVRQRSFRIFVITTMLVPVRRLTLTREWICICTILLPRCVETLESLLVPSFIWMQQQAQRSPPRFQNRLVRARLQSGEVGVWRCQFVQDLNELRRHTRQGTFDARRSAVIFAASNEDERQEPKERGDNASK